MNTKDTILFFIVLIIGAFLFYKAYRYGKWKKTELEAEAIHSIEKDLSRLRDKDNEYKVYKHAYNIFLKQTWDTSDIETLKKDVVRDCTKVTGGGGYVYTPAKYCLQINEEVKTIYYCIGRNEFDFSTVKRYT